MLLPEEAEELLEPLFLSMSEAVAAALGELCGIKGGLGGGGGGRSGAGAAGTQAHGVQGRRGSAAAAVLGLHGDIFPCFLLRLLKMEGEATGGALGPGAAVTGEEEEEEAGARRSGPGLAGRRLRGKGRCGRVASPAGRPDTLSRRGAGERAGCLGAGDRGLRHSDRHSPLGRGRAAPGMATSRQTASPRTRMDYLYSRPAAAMHPGECSSRQHPGPVMVPSHSPRGGTAARLVLNNAFSLFPFFPPSLTSSFFLRQYFTRSP